MCVSHLFNIMEICYNITFDQSFYKLTFKILKYCPLILLIT